MTAKQRCFAWVWLSATLLGVSAGCSGRPLLDTRLAASYTVEVRCRLPDGAPVENVLIANRETRASRYTDWQGKIKFRFDGYEGTEVSFRVASVPSGVAAVDDTIAHHLTLKSIASGAGASVAAGTLAYDISMRKKRESYVLLVSTRGAAALPVTANGIALGQLSSRGVGAFRVFGRPGEELKVVIRTADNQARYTLKDPERTFTLPQLSSILSFASTLAYAADADSASADALALRFAAASKKHHHAHHRRHDGAASVARTDDSKPVQIPFRAIEIK